MTGERPIGEHLQELSELAERVRREMEGEIGSLAEHVVEVLREGGRLLFCGNGGSAADAQHLAAEYVVRFRRRRRPLPALALTTDTSILTAGANDFGFDSVFRRQVEALGSEGDLLFLHSTSGDSVNLLEAADGARERGMGTVALLARDGGRLRERVDRALIVPTDSTALAQSLHLAIGHIVCDYVDTAFAEEDG